MHCSKRKNKNNRKFFLTNNRFKNWVLFCDKFSSEFINYLNKSGEVYTSKKVKLQSTKDVAEE